jgi:Tfp pilus assembly pilus retraction ATPase PilT
MNTVLLTPEQKKAFLEKHDLDYALAIVEPERYRVNLMFHKEGSAGSYRMVPHEIKYDARARLRRSTSTRSRGCSATTTGSS